MRMSWCACMGVWEDGAGGIPAVGRDGVILPLRTELKRQQAHPEHEGSLENSDTHHGGGAVACHTGRECQYLAGSVPQDQFSRSGQRWRGQLLLREETMLNSEHCGSSPAGGADLGVDVLDMVAGRLWRDFQACRDLLVGQAASELDQHLGL